MGILSRYIGYALWPGAETLAKILVARSVVDVAGMSVQLASMNRGWSEESRISAAYSCSGLAAFLDRIPLHPASVQIEKQLN